MKLFICLLTINFLTFIHDSYGQDLTDGTIEGEYGRAIKCKRDDGSSQRCMPVFENIAFGRNITANNTCGLVTPQRYCVQTGTSGVVKYCEICDDQSPILSHPAHYITDLKYDLRPTWWQSETMYENKYPVHLILELKKKYNVAFIRIRFRTIRPHSFAIYKKSTYSPEEKWLPYQFYSKTCERTYELPNMGEVSEINQKIALCSDEASGIIPLSGGNVVYSTLDHRPGKKNFDNEPDLQEWVTVTALRINLDRLNTFGDELFKDPKVLRSYYYAISDLNVGGRCKCNGHASTCNRNTVDGHYQCDCDHNTAGKDCEKCLPLYNDRPWRRASGRNANPCKACNCNDLADECVFDMQLWVDSNQRSGGRCINCKNNTDGINCERCKRFHFRNNPDEACKPCGCSALGSTSLRCNSKGECLCQRGVVGTKCDRCKDGYFGFSASGCQQCNCDVDGSIGRNCDASGQCQCKENVIGKKCDQCRVRYFDLDIENPKGCKACFCYGHGVSCTDLEGYGRKEIISSFDADTDGWTLQDENGVDVSENLRWDYRGQYVYITPKRNRVLYFVAPSYFLGDRLSSYAKKFSFLYGIFRQPGDPPVVTSDRDIIFEGRDGLKASYRITDQGNAVPAERFIQFSFKLVEPQGMSTFDFQKILADLRSIKIRVTYVQKLTSVINDVKMESTNFISPNSPEQVTWKEKCQCEKGYAGVQCEKCDKGFTRLKGDQSPYADCVPCSCNNHGNGCDPDTGKCLCQHNTTGDQCQQCLPGFYGNPTRGNPDDCKPCPCLYGNECIEIGNRIKCTDCQEGHIGDRCEKCDDGYYGDPEGLIGPSSPCKKCDCNGNIDSNAIGNCNSLTGECLKCIYNTKNGADGKCELCADGYYGDAVSYPKGNCTACNCFANGTLNSESYSDKSLLPCDNTGKCKCKANVVGKRCDSCPSGYWNVASGNGCELCQCNPKGSMGSECNLVTGQCKCKDGVGGRLCNECAAGHHKFSDDGCKACNCHPDGSKHENCTQDGVCECLDGVYGIKCNQCPENKYNLSVGCIACPKCFDLIQVEVNKLREKLENFNITSGNLTDGKPGINIKDENFEKLLEEYSRLVANLENMTNILGKEEKALKEFFDKLHDTFTSILPTMEDLQTLIEKSDGATTTGRNEITSAEKIIDEIINLLKSSESLLDSQKSALMNNTGTSNKDVGGIDKRMKEIAEKARELADKHVDQSKDIKSNTEMAYNTSEAAYNVAKDARDMQEKLNEDLKNNMKDLNEAWLLANESHKLIQDTIEKAENSSAMAEELIEKSKEEFPKTFADEIKKKAEVLSRDSKETTSESINVINTNQPTVEKFREDEKEAYDIIKAGRDLQNRSNELYEDAKSASEKAKQAQEDGLKVARQGQEMLEDLLGFNDRIEASKANASDAMKLIDSIRKLIKQANETTGIASENADTAEIEAKESSEKVKASRNVTDEAKMAIDKISDEAMKLHNETQMFIDNDVEELKNNINMTKLQHDRLKTKAKEDEMKIKNASVAITNSINQAVMSENDLQKALDSIEELIEKLNKLPEIDLDTLQKAEEDFANAKNKIEGQIQDDIESLQRKLVEEQELVKQYELDLQPLRKQIQENQDILDYIPKKCYRAEGGLENTRG